MVFNPAGHESKVYVEFQRRHAGKSRAVLVFLLLVFSIKTLFLTYWFYFVILCICPIHKACGMSVDISVESAHKCGPEKTFHRIAYEGGKFESSIVSIV